MKGEKKSNNIIKNKNKKKNNGTNIKTNKGKSSKPKRGKLKNVQNKKTIVKMKLLKELPILVKLNDLN